MVFFVALMLLLVSVATSFAAGTNVVVFRRAADITSGLVMHYPYEEGVGTATANLGSGPGPALLLNMDSTNWVPGKVGSFALAFPAADEIVHSGTNSAINFVHDGGEFTVAIWARVPDRDTTQNFLGTSPASGSLGFFFQWPFFSGTLEHEPRLAIHNNTATAYDANAVGTGVADSDWHHYAVTSTGTPPTLTFYVDGVAVGTNVASAFTSFDTGNSSNNFVMGAANDTVPLTSPFGGELDDVRIYDRALAPGDIQALVALQNPSDIVSNLLLHYPFEEGSGTTTASLGSSTITGILHNMGAANWVAGNVGSFALNFNGSDETVEVPSQTVVSFIHRTLGPFTVASWIRVLNAGERGILTGNAVAASSVGWYWQWYTFDGIATNAIRMVVFNGSGTNAYQIRTVDNIITDTNWHHVALTGDGDPANLKFYVDGVEVGWSVINPFTSLSSANATRTFGIASGNPPPALTLPFEGDMDDVRVYTRELSQVDIQALVALGN